MIMKANPIKPEIDFKSLIKFNKISKDFSLEGLIMSLKLSHKHGCLLYI